MTEFMYTFQFHGEPKPPLPHCINVFSHDLSDATEQVKNEYPYRHFKLIDVQELCEACEI